MRHDRLMLACALATLLLGAASAQPPKSAYPLAPGTAGNCEATHQQCVAQNQARCDRPASTSDEREQCLQSCVESLSACKAKQATQAAALAQVLRSGGPQPGQCPKGWMLEQRSMNNFGTFKCFATGATGSPGSDASLPATFACPPGLKLVRGIDAVFCSVPD